jgi:hypothetical protein
MQTRQLRNQYCIGADFFDHCQKGGPGDWRAAVHHLGACDRIGTQLGQFQDNLFLEVSPRVKSFEQCNDQYLVIRRIDIFRNFLSPRHLGCRCAGSDGDCRQ